jgi:putative serine protease XkdF
MDRGVISKLYEVDPEFRAVYDRLYGVAKSMDGADVHVDGTASAAERKKQRRIGQVGLAATGVAGVGGAHAIDATVRNFKHDKGALKNGTYEAGPILRKLKLSPKKAIAVGTAGWVGLHATELGADALAARAQTKAIKANSAKVPVSKAFSLKPINPVRPLRPSLAARRRPGLTSAPSASLSKGFFRDTKTTMRNAAEASGHASQAASDISELTGKVKRLIPKRLTAAGIGAATVGALGGAAFAGSHAGAKSALTPRPPKQPAGPVIKSITLRAQIAKLDTDKRQVFGWASVSTINGEVVLDRQNDINEIDEIEKSAYRYVLESRVGGDQHSRIAKSTTAPKHTSDLIESMVFTDEKVKAMGLPDSFPRGWWVGMQVSDEPTWQAIKNGERTGFSVHGTGRREDVFV